MGLLQRDSVEKSKNKKKNVELMKILFVFAQHLLRMNRRWVEAADGSKAAGMEAGVDGGSRRYLLVVACWGNVMGGLVDLADQVVLACQC